MYSILADGALEGWGQAAALMLTFGLFFSTLIGLMLAVALMMAFAWVREKAELVKKLRPTVDSINSITSLSNKGVLPAAGSEDNKIVHTVARVSERAHAIEQKLEQGSDHVANTVIEFRARTVMVQRILKAFFLPGLD